MVTKHEVIQAITTNKLDFFTWPRLWGAAAGRGHPEAETEPKSLCQHRGRACGCTSESSSPASAQLPCVASGQPLLSNGLHLGQATAGSDPQPPLCSLRPAPSFIPSLWRTPDPFPAIPIASKGTICLQLAPNTHSPSPNKERVAPTAV